MTHPPYAEHPPSAEQQPYAGQPPYAAQQPAPYGQPMQGWQPPFPPQQPKKGSGLGIAALVLGIVGLLLSWIPIVNYVAMVLGLVGLVLGIIGILKSHRVMSIIGTVLSLLAIVVSIVVTASFATAVDEAVDQINAATESASIDGSAEAGASAGASDAVAADADTNTRGNVVSALGQEEGITDESGAPLLSFAVDSLTVDPTCTSDWQDYGTPVDTGHHLVAVQVRVTTSPQVSDSDFLGLGAHDFEYIGADGVTVSSLDGAATYGCLDDGDTFPSDLLGPGQSYAGAVVLDVPAAAGTLVLDPSWGQEGGWEYSF